MRFFKFGKSIKTIGNDTARRTTKKGCFCLCFFFLLFLRGSESPFGDNANRVVVYSSSSNSSNSSSNLTSPQRLPAQKRNFVRGVTIGWSDRIWLTVWCSSLARLSIPGTNRRFAFAEEHPTCKSLASCDTSWNR